MSLTLLIELEEVARRIAMYKAAVKEAKPVGKFINNQAAAYTLVYCAETDEQARREAAKSMEWYIDYSSQIASEFARKIAPGGDAGGYDYYKQTGNLSTKKLTTAFRLAVLKLIGDAGDGSRTAWPSLLPSLYPEAAWAKRPWSAARPTRQSRPTESANPRRAETPEFHAA